MVCPLNLRSMMLMKPTKVNLTRDEFLSKWRNTESYKSIFMNTLDSGNLICGGGHILRDNHFVDKHDTGVEQDSMSRETTPLRVGQRQMCGSVHSFEDDTISDDERVVSNEKEV